MNFHNRAGYVTVALHSEHHRTSQGVLTRTGTADIMFVNYPQGVPFGGLWSMYYA